MSWISIVSASFNTLEESQIKNNADIITAHFLKLGWTKEAIAGMLGNLAIESYLNPAQYEAGYNYAADKGYGLAQWTPVSKYQNWATAKGYDVTDGDKQLEWIEIMPSGEWFQRSSTTQYYLPYDEFQKSTADPAFLARVWDDSFERSWKYDEAKTAQAEYWYKYISGKSYKKKFPIYFYLKHR